MTSEAPAKPKRRVVVDVRAGIVKASLGLFAANGYEGVSVRDLAKAAGITMPMIYHYFPDKQAVYDAALEAAYAYNSRRLMEAIKSTDHLTGEDRLREFLKKYVVLLASLVPEVHLVYRNIIDAKPSRFARLHIDLWRIPNRAVAGLLSDIAPRSDIPVLTELFSGTVYGVIRIYRLDASLRGESKLDTDAIANAIFEMTISNLKNLPPMSRIASRKRPKSYKPQAAAD